MWVAKMFVRGAHPHVAEFLVGLEQTSNCRCIATVRTATCSCWFMSAIGQGNVLAGAQGGLSHVKGWLMFERCTYPDVAGACWMYAPCRRARTCVRLVPWGF